MHGFLLKLVPWKVTWTKLPKAGLTEQEGILQKYEKLQEFFFLCQFMKESRLIGQPVTRGILVSNARISPLFLIFP